MSLIIDHTYFNGKLSLPQAGDALGRERIQEFIDTYEPEFLQKALGYELWKEFSAGIDGSGEPTEQRWIDLLYGKEFTYNSRTYKWPGFADEATLKSPIANYVYFQFLKSESHSVSRSGAIVQPLNTNADNVSPGPKMVAAWNEMVDINFYLWGFLYENRAVYPEWTEYETPGIISWKFNWWWNSPKSEVFIKINEFNL